MASLTTIARPYARAAFEYAQAAKAVAKWSEQLALLAAIARDPLMQTVLAQPKRSRAERGELLLSICEKKVDENVGNFVRLLAENGRLNTLPEIAEQFEQLRAEEESTVDARMVAAQEVPAAQLKAIEKALEKRFGKKVQLNSEIDPALIGGAVIKVGDLVIDGTVKNRLQKLASRLLH